jgi:hypothetical protein
MSATPPTVIAQLVETMRALAGLHPGFRPVHAKGVVCSGTFRGARGARSEPGDAPAKRDRPNRLTLL